MIDSFAALHRAVQGGRRRTLAVAAAADAQVLLAVEAARRAGLAEAVLVADQGELRRLLLELDIDAACYQIVDQPDAALACAAAVRLVADGRAQVLMKGLVDTSLILKSLLDKEHGLREADTLSHLALFETPGYDRLLFVSDAAMHIAPDVAAKAAIIRNAVRAAHALGNPDPIVACLASVEKVNPKMQATLDAAELVRMNRSGLIADCRVTGPLALDNAVDISAARHKGIADPLAGRADILLVPQIDAGNVLYKSLVFMARAQNAGVILGAKSPVVLTSRADTELTKLHSIALAIFLSRR